MPTTLVKLALILALSVVALSLLAIGGCRSGSTASAQTPTSPDDETDWFCQEDGNSGEWDCVQDDALARNPEMARRAPEDSSD